MLIIAALMIAACGNQAASTPTQAPAASTPTQAPAASTPTQAPAKLVV
ncbi:MAG: sugar ABC transporter substrate-binding protein, partial [Chloroflexi bacterium]